MCQYRTAVIKKLSTVSTPEYYYFCVYASASQPSRRCLQVNEKGISENCMSWSASEWKRELRKLHVMVCKWMEKLEWDVESKQIMDAPKYKSQRVDFGKIKSPCVDPMMRCRTGAHTPMLLGWYVLWLMSRLSSCTHKVEVVSRTATSPQPYWSCEAVKLAVLSWYSWTSMYNAVWLWRKEL